MRLRGKLLLIAIVPLLLALGLTALALRQQQYDLARRQAELVRNSVTETTQSELRHYVALALSTISPLYNTGRDDDEIKRLAMKQLAQLDYGPDGYFFLYDFDGTNLMHPRQPELVGKNLMEMRDARGLQAIKAMIQKAEAGGGFVTYSWNKPSIRQIVPKMAYVTGLARWNWMIGTGIYTDDLDRVMGQLDNQIKADVTSTLEWLGLVALAAVVVIFVSTLGISITELRAADAKLTLLARKLVQSQEAERAWLARELHDSTSQTLVSVKLLTESALDRLTPPEAPLRAVLQRALDRVNRALNEVRDISHRLRPAELDSLGLSTALREMGQEMCSDAGMAFELTVQDEALALPDAIKTTLFRVSQEALTNVLKHARATAVKMTLTSDADALRLRIEDDGRGFDSEAVAQHPQRGIGLRNMRERLMAVGGTLQLSSRPQRTVLVAEVPADAVRRFAEAA